MKSKENITQKIIDRCQMFWDRLLLKIKGIESEHKDILCKFEEWYNCGKFGREWAIEQLHKVVVDFSVSIHIHTIKKLLEKDLRDYTKIVFDIIKKLSIKFSRLDERDILAHVLEYIHEHSNDEELQNDKRIFTNDFLASRSWNPQYWFDKIEPYS